MNPVDLENSDLLQSIVAGKFQSNDQFQPQYQYPYQPHIVQTSSLQSSAQLQSKHTQPTQPSLTSTQLSLTTEQQTLTGQKQLDVNDDTGNSKQTILENNSQVFQLLAVVEDTDTDTDSDSDSDSDSVGEDASESKNPLLKQVQYHVVNPLASKLMGHETYGAVCSLVFLRPYHSGKIDQSKLALVQNNCLQKESLLSTKSESESESKDRQPIQHAPYRAFLATAAYNHWTGNFDFADTVYKFLPVTSEASHLFNAKNDLENYSVILSPTSIIVTYKQTPIQKLPLKSVTDYSHKNPLATYIRVASDQKQLCGQVQMTWRNKLLGMDAKFDIDAEFNVDSKYACKLTSLVAQKNKHCLEIKN